MKSFAKVSKKKIKKLFKISPKISLICFHDNFRKENFSKLSFIPFSRSTSLIPQMRVRKLIQLKHKFLHYTQNDSSFLSPCYLVAIFHCNNHNFLSTVPLSSFFSPAIIYDSLPRFTQEKAAVASHLMIHFFWRCFNLFSPSPSGSSSFLRHQWK
jgi:hypothetical protein